MMREVINGNIEIINPDNSDTFFENANHCNIQVFCSTNYMGIELYIPNEDEPGYFTQAYKFVCPVNELDEDIREDIAFRFSNALQGINKEEMLNELTNIILESDKVLDEEYPYIEIDELRPDCYEDKMEQYDNINITLYKENDSSFSIKVQFNEFVEEEFDDDGEYYYNTYYHSEHSPYIKFTDEQQEILKNKYEKQAKEINMSEKFINKHSDLIYGDEISSIKETLKSATNEIDAVVGKDGQIQQNINTHEKQTKEINQNKDTSENIL